MSTSNRTLSSTTTFRRDEKTNSITSTVRYNTVRIPTPEPRKKLNYNNEETNQCHSLDSQINNATMITEKQPGIKRPPRHIPIRIERRYEEPNRTAPIIVTPTAIPSNRRYLKRVSTCDAPIDEGVCSPSNMMGYESEDCAADEFEPEEEEDEFSSSDQVNELTNLSKQSMVPLHELIAYYQYIQRGDAQQDNQSRERISRQSSSASQQITRTDSNLNSTGDIDHSGIKSSLEDESNDLSACETKVISRAIPKILVENLDEADSASTIDTVQCSKDKRRIRANVVLELINSERDFVKHLRDVVEGYLLPARKHPEIFTFDRINTIFANIEQLYDFQRKFLQNLELSINWDDPASSEVGNCFLKFESGFSVYHYYCNNHPNASSELQELYAKPRFVKFFEACRVLQNMIDISLDGFLLTPIQKICKYPLQLNELLKNTEDDHPDHKPVADALESMRNCANVANERKRRIEALADVISFQERVENWTGQKLCDTSSIMIHSGEVSKITSQMKPSQCIQLHLFDHLLLMSKKDLLKRNILIARVNMNTVTKISDADEYKPKRGFKLYCSEQEKWFVFAARTEKERDEWIEAFERERNLVASDENEGFRITGREIGVARRTLQSRKHCRSARYRLKRPDTAIVDQLDIDDANTIMNRTLSLPSCMHPSHVMNFVEDSKVVSNRKKSSSPSSPQQGSQTLVEQENQSAGGWFKKMGSKKIARGQLHNINTGTATTKSTTSPPATTVANSPLSNNKYDELEKRHRDHMISEEQARLFRLNNDLPAPSSVKSPFNHRSSADRRSISAENNSHLNQTAKDIQSQTYINPSDLDLNAMSMRNIDSTSHTKVTNQSSLIKKEAIINPEENSFEATLVLPSGRVVRVREDAV